MESKSDFDKIIHKLGNYETPSDRDLDYIIELCEIDTSKLKKVVYKYNEVVKALMLLNEFLIKEMD